MRAIELIESGYLVRSRVYAPSKPDLTNVHVRRGDYVESELDELMNKSKLVADIVGSWLKLGERRRTICFATSVGHSVHLRDQFIESGVRAEELAGFAQERGRKPGYAFYKFQEKFGHKSPGRAELHTFGFIRPGAGPRLVRLTYFPCGLI